MPRWHKHIYGWGPHEIFRSSMIVIVTMMGLIDRSPEIYWYLSGKYMYNCLMWIFSSVSAISLPVTQHMAAQLSCCCWYRGCLVTDVFCYTWAVSTVSLRLRFLFEDGLGGATALWLGAHLHLKTDMLRCSYVISSIIGFVYMTISSQSTFYTVGPDNVELMCVDSYVELRGLSDIECAIFTSQDISHNYAFTVRGGRCYVCRITDSLRLHNGEELSLKGPHLIAGEDICIIHASPTPGLVTFKIMHVLL